MSRVQSEKWLYSYRTCLSFGWLFLLSVAAFVFVVLLYRAFSFLLKCCASLL